MRPQWMVGIALGLVIGGAVVLVSSVRYGFSAPLLLLGVTLAIVFGAVGVVGAVVSRRRPVD